MNLLALFIVRPVAIKLVIVGATPTSRFAANRDVGVAPTVLVESDGGAS